MAADARAMPGDCSRQFWPVLRHALSECCLIIMLFVTALVSYSATRLAHICRLRSPCILCSRLDRLLHGKAWFSEELVCAAHRLEIARLSYCQIHQKLSRSDDLCERCLRSCIGKPGNRKNISIEETVNSRSRSRHKQRCSCCSVPFEKTGNAHRMSEIANGRLPNDDWSKEKERRIAMASVGHSSDDGSDHLPCERYSRLKLRHDSDSEIHISDDDGNAVLREARDRAKDISSHDVQMPPRVSGNDGLSMLPSDNTVMKKSVKSTNTVKSADWQSRDNKVGNVTKSSDRSIGHGLDEINWSEVNASDNKIDMQWKATPEKVCTELPKEKTFVVGIEEAGDTLEGVSGSSDDLAMKGFAASANAGTSSSADAHVNSNNSTKNASGSRGYLKSPRLSEIISARDTNSKTNEEVKTFLSQLSSARGFDGPWNDTVTSPRISAQIDEFRQYDSTGMASFLERNNSNLEPFDATSISEDEGESSLERLKQQAEHNKKKMGILYKELEAERSASAVAASEAMAMINRLQEEKAAMHMEALQYLRMMEEQADHDQEAIERLNDLLTEREKEVLDLEAELVSRSRLHEPFDIGKFGASDGSMAFGDLDGSNFIRDTMFDFEDEKAKILESLYRLEETLGMSSTNRLDFGDTNDNLLNGPLRDDPRRGTQHIEHPELGPSLLPVEQVNGESVSSQENDENQSVENQKSFAACSHLDEEKHPSMTNVKYEVSLLNTRFKALEADQNFLRQIVSSLTCSSDGVQCVQEITSHLRELRRITTEQRDMAVS
ncbi:hypothetical protein EJB05_07919 [Eragrostis curvula]|uniref:GTD-binding domain-containing protein n=1 Tax=Eragrostis curvula TaxID=38414 RepID=A0A5J9WJ84_9POAL|nr:hypothetical protein EJB05_07919 [Eragrostis curvula]